MRIYLKKTLLLMICITILGCARDAHELIPVDFDVSLGQGSRVYREMMHNPADRTRYQLLKSIWLQQGPHVEALCSEGAGAVPHIIHQIWLGPYPLPSFFHEYQNALIKLHPDWKYCLWTDADIESECPSLWPYIEASTNYGQKSDLVRLEILSRYGGVYLDVDVLAIKSFDSVADRYDFFAGLEAPHYIGERSPHHLFISNAIIGCVAHHPVLQIWKEKILKKWDCVQKMDIDYVQKVLLSTFFTFGDAVLEGIQASPRSVVFPPTYFYPIKPPNKTETKKKEPGILKQILRFLHIKKRPIFSTIQRETIAVHDFASTWQGEP